VVPAEIGPEGLRKVPGMGKGNADLTRESWHVRWRRRFRTNRDICLEYLIAIAKTVKFFRADAILAEGKEIHSGLSVRVFYFGNYRNYRFMFKTIFSEFTTTEVHKKVLALDVIRWARRYEGKSDLVIIDLGYVYSKMFKLFSSNYICVPDSVGQSRDIRGSKSDFVNSFRGHGSKAKHIKRMLRQNITARFVSSERCFEDFYRYYYLPLARRRFDDAAVIEKKELFLRKCRDGEVMQVVRENEVMAYALLQSDSGTLRSLLVGVSEKIDEETYSIVFNALYYYSFLFGYDNGYDEVDLCNTRALLNDGVYIYKRTWGAYVYACSDLEGNMFVRPTNLNEPVTNIFSRNYFVTRQNDKLIARILWGDGEMSVDIMGKFVKNYYSKGLDAIRIYSLTKIGPEVAQWFEENNSFMEFVDLSDHRDPLEAFCS
jgi:hypothetical protein